MKIPVTALTSGNIYVLKADVDIPFFIQIGCGGDAGVFLGQFREDLLGTIDYQFRIVINESDIRKNWKSLGNFELHDGLHKPYQYASHNFSGSGFILIPSDDVGTEVPADEHQLRDREPLAIFTGALVIKRLHGKDVGLPKYP